MGKLTETKINGKIRAGERFEVSDGDGLTLAFRQNYQAPVWRLRYRYANKPRVMILGSYRDLPLPKARATAKDLRARVRLGHDVAKEKQDRIRDTAAAIEADRNRLTVGQLADKFFARYILGEWKHPEIVRSRIERRIKPAIGSHYVEDVRPRHIDDMLQGIKADGAPTIANDVLRITRRIFAYGVKLEVVEMNPASAFEQADAGGTEEPRERALSRDELVMMFDAMRRAQGFSVENALSCKLLLLLAVRKSELCEAPVAEFDLKTATWALPAERTKTGVAIDIPLPKPAVTAIRELVRLGGGDDYLLPARKAQDRMLPHIATSTLNVALGKVRRLMPGVEPFTIHDFRRTARTHLAALGVDRHIAERCLNHKIKGVEGTYDRHEYFDERRKALATWATFLEQCEAERPAKRPTRK